MRLRRPVRRGVSLHELFELLERMPVPEGYKAEVVEGTVHMSPQRDAHWETIRRIVRALEDRCGMDARVKSDVRIDFPDSSNGFAPDVAKLRDSAGKGHTAGRRGGRTKTWSSSPR
ncbi:Uma2 family endonuclease [Streptomyces sp. RKND-216]|uniref:Uma2 family endonuclease n=1 Tax=Streptomyces sp. RKND-216 TaxID=2562581 RepID=UPI0032B58387